MAQQRMVIEIAMAGALPRDVITNTFYLDDDFDIGNASDRNGVADDARDLWFNSISIPSGYRVRCKRYENPGAGPTGEPDYVSPWSVASQTGEGGPREVALCLSFYADENTPRKRGRLYIGPLTKSRMGERPDVTLRQQLQALAEGISGLGGINVQWVQFSSRAGVFSNVTNYFIDDEWDTQRSRGLSPTTRTTGTVNG